MRSRNKSRRRLTRDVTEALPSGRTAARSPTTFPPFSASTRRADWGRLGRESFDLLVIGGGATGAGVAWDAADRGLRVALVDAGDWARGTSSRSSRLIHGGLRYLQTRDFGLVFEASGERRRLLDLAPHLVQPLPFFFPVYEDGPVGYRMLQAGMWLYDALALFRNIGRHKMLDRAESLGREPGLRREGLLGGAVYYDARVNDARLALAAVRAAHQAGAATLSYAEITGFSVEDGVLRGAIVRDRLSGDDAEVRARIVVNATGPWSDEVREMADPAVVPRLRPTKGVHIVVQRGRVGNHGALTFQSPVDGRVMFVLPWEQFTYIGTTDTDHQGPLSDVNANAEDVAYLLASANALFPEARLDTDDVISTWAGLRPLLASQMPEAIESEGQTSREHEIWQDDSGLLNIAGGKLTTFRVMAEEVTDAAAEILADTFGLECRPSRTDTLPLPGAPEEDWEAFLERVRDVSADVGLGSETADHLARSHGTEAIEILAAVRADTAVGAPLVPGLPPIQAEVDHAVRKEMALTLEDVLQRRLNVIYLTEDGGLGIAPDVAERMARTELLGWTNRDVERQLEDFAASVRQTRSFRTGE